MVVIVFFFNDAATTEIYTLSLHDALPIYGARCALARMRSTTAAGTGRSSKLRTIRRRRTTSSNCTGPPYARTRSEEHTSELQSQSNLVCRLMLETKTITHVLFRTTIHSMP